jgi:Gpi18-like mannosyltransferase
MTASSAGRAWTTRDRLLLALTVLAAIAIRVALLPTSGLTGDMAEFARWIHGIVQDGLPRAYDQDLTFPPVMAYVWALIGAAHPSFATSASFDDASVRAVMKVPASLADLGLAAAMVWWFRDRPGTALIAVAGTLLLPVTWYTSAWWGQYESIYVLWAVLALCAARADRPHVAAALLALSVLSKPQALPFLVPFAAWVFARGGVRLVATTVLTGALVAVVLWLPFLAAAGPANYLASIGAHQNDTFNVLSLRAWNPWWLVQGQLIQDAFVADGNTILGPLTFRHIGLVLAGLLEVLVFMAVLRRPTIEQLVLGTVLASLGAYLTLTTMHERYAYPAVILLTLLIAERRYLVAWLVAQAVVALNLIAAAPATSELGAAIRIDGPLALPAVIVLLGVAVLVAARLLATSSAEAGPSTGGRASVVDLPSGV